MTIIEQTILQVINPTDLSLQTAEEKTIEMIKNKAEQKLFDKLTELQDAIHLATDIHNFILICLPKISIYQKSK